MLIVLIVIFIEAIYISYHFLYKGKKYIYFDSINSVFVTDKYYIAVGSNNDNDSHFEKSKLSIYNMKREKIFERIYNNGYNSAFFDTINTEDGIIAVGSYEKSKSDHSNLIRNALIVKYDYDGNVIFDTDYKLLDNTKYTSVASYNKDYICSGQSVYKNTRVGSEAGGAILTRYDSDGNIIWSVSYGDNKQSTFNDLVIVEDKIYAVGYYKDNESFLVQYNMNGELISEVKYDTDSKGFSSIVYDDSYLFIAGSKINNNGTDAVILKYDLNGNIIGESIFDDGGNERYNKLIADSDKNIIIIGTASDIRDKSHNTVDEYDYNGIIAKYNSSLEKIDIIKYGDDKDDYFTDIIEDKGKYLIVGYSSYEDDGYMAKFIIYSKALKVLEVG